MDLALHLRVIWRFRYLVAVGLLVAVCLTILATARVDFNGGPHLVYRQSEVWAGRARLLLTQPGVPWGRTVFPDTSTTASSSKKQQQQPIFADPGRLSSLASFYAQLGNSDAVQRHLPRGAVTATPVVDTSTNYTQPLPILEFLAVAPTPQRANRLAGQAAAVFTRYVTQQQNAANIPSGQRVYLQTLNRPAEPQLVKARKMTLPIVVFLTMLVATLALAFVLENLRPRVRIAEAEPTTQEVVNDRLVQARAQRSG